MSSFMNGESICPACLIRLPTDLKECRKRIVELETFIKSVRLITYRLAMPTEQEVLELDEAASNLQVINKG